MLSFLAVCEVDSQTQQFFVKFSDMFNKYLYWILDNVKKMSIAY